MFKVFNKTSAASGIFNSISNGFLDFMPYDKFIEVEDIKNADVIFTNGSIQVDAVNINIANGFPQADLSNLYKLSELYGDISNKKWMIWLDVMGPNIHDNPGIYDKITGLSDSDILISPASLPPRPNVFTHIHHIEKSVFRPRHRFERQQGSVAICHDNVTNLREPERNISGIIADILDVVSHLYITNTPYLGEDLQESFSRNIDKVSCNSLTYPQGVSFTLAKSEFILSTHTKIGVEYMGIEGGMCGCQPIYPDTEFYRDVFDETGVVFYDTNDAAESIKSIISKGSTFTDEHVDQFREKFSAEDNLPDFWDKAYNILNS